jgi:CRISPR system Cascade subunit CasA
MQPSFNLIDQPWIGAVDHAGQLQEYSLRDLLLHAHELRELHDDSPLVIASQLRMILALLHRIYEGPANRHEWQAIWQSGRFEEARIDRYFAQWHDRFDLFHPQFPFYQTLNWSADEQSKPISTLLFDLATGNNATLFDHTTDEMPIALSCEAAARTLITAQTFGLAGPCNPQLKLYFTDGTAARGISFFAVGDSLFETLVLNLIAYPADRPIASSELDQPAWEMENAFVPDREVPFGYLDYLTWQNRRLRLLPEQVGDELKVKRILLTPGLRLAPSVLEQDPMKHYRIDEKRGYISLRFQEERALWRDSATLLQLNATDRQVPAIIAWLGQLVTGRVPVLDHSQTMRYMALGMASDQAKIEFYRSEFLPLPLDYLTDSGLVQQLETALKAAEAVKDELWKATGTLARWLLVPDEESDRQPNPDDVRDLRATMAAERRYWALLEPHFRQTMQAIPQDSSAALAAWFAWLRQSAWDVFDQVCNGLGDDPRVLKAVVRGREQLARGLGVVLKIQA